jgi:hypothetical protein
MRYAVAGSILGAIFAVTGCSGGGAPAVNANLPAAGTGASQPAAPSASAAPSSSAAPATETAPVTFTYRLPVPAGGSSGSARRKPQYLSLATQSFVITITNAGVATTTVLNVSSGQCTRSTTAPEETCTSTLLAPAGADTFMVAAYDKPQPTTVPALTYVGNLLGTVKTSVTVRLGTSNTVLLTLDGVVSTVKLVLDSPSPPLGTSATIGLLVLAYDADGYLVLGPYSQPVTITDSDVSGDTALLENGTSVGTSATLTASGPAFSLSYSGAPVTAVLSGNTTGVRYVDAFLTPTSASPTHLIYVLGYNPSTLAAQVDGYDLASQTRVSGSTTKYSIANLLSARLICGDNCYSPFVYFGLGPQNQFVTTAEVKGTDYAEYYQAAPLAASPGSAPLTIGGPPIAYYTGVAEGQAVTGASPPILDPAGDILQSVFSTQSTSAQALQWARFLPGDNGPEDIDAASTFYLAAFGPFGKFDPEGNFWQFSTAGLQEYRAGSISNPAKDAKLTPLTTIGYGTAAGQLPAATSSPQSYDIAFGSGHSVYVSTANDEIYVFKAVAAGTNSTLTASEYFKAASIGSGYFPSILVDPAGTGDIILVNEANQTLDYYYGPGSKAPANGTSVEPFKQVSLPLAPLSGGIYSANPL